MFAGEKFREDIRGLEESTRLLRHFTRNTLGRSSFPCILHDLERTNAVLRQAAHFRQSYAVGIT